MSSTKNLLGREFFLLADALKNSSNESAGSLLSNALQFRSQRWDWIENTYGAPIQDTERFLAMSEGTARYVENLLMIEIAQSNSANFLANDPEFQSFESYKKVTLSGWISNIATNAKIQNSTSKKYWYNLGLSYSLILDRLQPDWKTHIFKEPHFFDSLFQQGTL
jgi:hypothetical protein